MEVEGEWRKWRGTHDGREGSEAAGLFRQRKWRVKVVSRLSAWPCELQLEEPVALWGDYTELEKAKKKKKQGSRQTRRTEEKCLLLSALGGKGTTHAAMTLKDAYSLEPRQPRQHIKKQRHSFADKGLSSQSYGFSSSHIWMWELDYKESWALKNWCFWTGVLEKTLESPLDCKENQPVHPKGDQS